MTVTLRILTLAALLLTAACSREHAAPPGGRPDSGSGVTAQSSAPPLEGVSVGSPMPAYKATMLDGSPFDVEKLKGEVVLLNVWATWCGPCVYEIPVLQALHNKHRAQKFQVVGITLDEKDLVEDVRKFVAGRKMQYPVVLDPEAKIADLFNISVLPTSLLLDREGKIVWFHTGMIEENHPPLVEALNKVL